ncbi:MAG: TolC family protein [Gemmataceae bacterium]|nr:TolC family protein [Gemmataceae bacterium]MCI0738739.1 TolC family protein [Gemmataceae bacterium]
MKRATSNLLFVVAWFGIVRPLVAQTVGHHSTAPRAPVLSFAAIQPLTLSDLIHLALERNPRLAQAGYAVEGARGRAVQAGLYPNPTFSVTGDELGDRQEPGGIWTAPYVSQEFVTGRKLGLSKAAAGREVDQAALALAAQRYAVFTAIRQSYYEVLALQRRSEVLEGLVKDLEKSVKDTRKLVDAKQLTRPDLLQLELELERYQAEREAAQRELPATFRRLAAAVGVTDLPFSTLTGAIETGVPDYDFDQVRNYLLQVHPEIQIAQIGVQRARTLVQRAQAEAIPNVTVGAGYVRQNQNRSDDWTIGVSLPVPLWNRNQGNIRAAQAQVGEATAAVSRVENDLVGRLASAFATYASARQRADRYRTAILPRVRENYELSVKLFKGGQMEYFRVLQAHRAIADADLEYIRVLRELWDGAAQIAGLLLAEEWPSPSPAVAPKTAP